MKVALAPDYLTQRVDASARPEDKPIRFDGPEPLVLHVVESYGGGVAAVLRDYARSAAAWRHVVLASSRPGHEIGGSVSDVFETVETLPHGHFSRIRAIRRSVRRLNPAVVHAHSSFAGLYVRLALGRGQGHKFVYTPHCYSFERTDAGPVARSLFWLIEATLSLRGGQVAAVSPREAKLAATLPGRVEVTYVPNIALAEPTTADPSALPQTEPHRLTIAAVGRVSPQKNPQRFAEASRLAARSLPCTRWIWVGGGDPALETDLRSAGVEVTGWLSRTQARARLLEADLYVHCADWEGAPLTILEAAAAGIPIIGFDTEALRSLGVAPLFDTSAELVRQVSSFAADDDRDVYNQCRARLLAAHTEEAQSASLAHVYGRASAAGAAA